MYYISGDCFRTELKQYRHQAHYSDGGLDHSTSSDLLLGRQNESTPYSSSFCDSEILACSSSSSSLEKSTSSRDKSRPLSTYSSSLIGTHSSSSKTCKQNQGALRVYSNRQLISDVSSSCSDDFEQHRHHYELEEQIEFREQGAQFTPTPPLFQTEFLSFECTEEPAGDDETNFGLPLNAPSQTLGADPASHQQTNKFRQSISDIKRVIRRIRLSQKSRRRQGKGYLEKIISESCSAETIGNNSEKSSSWTSSSARQPAGGSPKFASGDYFAKKPMGLIAPLEKLRESISKLRLTRRIERHVRNESRQGVSFNDETNLPFMTLMA